MSKTCGECRWYLKEDDELGDCIAPVPVSLFDQDKRAVHPYEIVATDCPCYQPREETDKGVKDE